MYCLPACLPARLSTCASRAPNRSSNQIYSRHTHCCFFFFFHQFGSSYSHCLLASPVAAFRNNTKKKKKEPSPSGIYDRNSPDTCSWSPSHSYIIMSSVHNKSQPALPNPFLVCSFGDTRQQQHKEQRTDSTIHPLSTALAASARRPPSSDQRNGPSGSIPSAFGSSSTWGDSIWTPGNVGFANTLASNTTSRENSYSRGQSTLIIHVKLAG